MNSVDYAIPANYDTVLNTDNGSVPNVYIDSIALQVNKDIGLKSKYLHTSPELEMKKRLAQGSGDIYQICQVFRDNEQGIQNFNEFRCGNSF
jgi:lysyl-tRNA synthetase class 2